MSQSAPTDKVEVDSIEEEEVEEDTPVKEAVKDESGQEIKVEAVENDACQSVTEITKDGEVQFVLDEICYLNVRNRSSGVLVEDFEVESAESIEEIGDIKIEVVEEELIKGVLLKRTIKRPRQEWLSQG